jgi:maltose O-acetyltransferase
MKKFFFIFFAILNNIKLHFLIRRLGNILDKFRMKLLSKSGSKIGKNSTVREKTFILFPENLEIGQNSSIGSNSEIFNSKKITIGDDVDIGTQFYINTENHKLDNSNLPLTKQGVETKEIMIGSDVWIGARVTVLMGAKINNRVVVGAGSLVNKDLESGYIYAGIPAKKIKKI